MVIDADLQGEMAILGQLVVASNATLLVEISGIRAVYKPIAGEQPLWDFPDRTLALREVAAYRISELLGWSIVPLTILREGPYGVGAVQRWIDIDDVDLIALAQSVEPRLSQIAIFDAVINNTDRKVSHLLPAEGTIYGCDHGVSFHVDDKLRTVLWQWRGQPIPDPFLNDLVRLRQENLEHLFEDLLAAEEIAALRRRLERLISERLFPQPNPEWPAVPWPPV